MAVIATNLGKITAYGDAVAAGYTGTKAEWQALMASYATVAETAQGYASDAQGYAEDAQGYASDAQGYANNASTYAGSASSSATTANNAKSAAETAQGYAEDAQEAAESARDAVQSSATQISTNTTAIGTMTDLTTDTQTDLVSAINEVDANCNTNANAISTLNTDLTAISETTRNLFFGDFANGNIDANGAEYTQTNFLRCVEFIPVAESTTYMFQVWTTSTFSQVVLVEYDSDKSVVARRGIVSSSSTMTYRAQTFTTNSNVSYIRFLLYSASAISTSGNKAQIELGTTATEYISYHVSAVDRFVRGKFDDNGLFSGEEIQNDSLPILKTKNIFEYEYQYIFMDDVETGKYYADSGAIASASMGAIVPYSIPVQADVTYNYRGLYNRHCLLVIDDTITFFADTDTYVDGSITPSDDGYVLITIPYDSTDGIRDTCMFCRGELPNAGRVEGGYGVSLINSTANPKNTVISVSLDGTKDFTSIKDAIDSITDANEFNTYTIQIYEGTYDVKSYYTEEEWSVESTAFIGLTVPDYVTLEGIGSRDAVILTATDSTARNYISTINLSNVGGLKNLTIKSDGLRYAVHDDYSSNDTVGYRELENCVFEQANGYYVQAYGAGFHDRDTVVMKSCISKTDADGYSISFHNNTDFVYGSHLEFENCRFGQTGLNFITIADGADNTVLLKGVKADSLVLNRQTSNTGIAFKVSGYANDITTVTVSLSPASDYVDLI